MRERINIDDETQSYLQSRESYSGDIYTTYVTRNQFSAFWDVETPDFYARRNAGEVINNPMYSVMQDLNLSFVRLGWDHYGYNGVSYGARWNLNASLFGPAALVTTAEIDVLLGQYQAERDVATAKAWSNVDVSELQALASLGELPETLFWLASLSERMIRILRMFKQRTVIRNGVKLFLSPTKSVITAAEFWLEYRYAVRPLIFEAAQATAAIQNVIKKGSRITARGSHYVEVTETESDTFIMSSAYDTSVTLGSKVTRRSKYRAGVLYDIGDDINGLTALWGLDQPLESIWELVPFSFIMDWFFNVGTTLASWTANPDLTPLTSWITEQHTFLAGEPFIVDSTLPAVDQHATDPNWVAYDAYADSVVGGSSVTLIKRRTVCPPRAILPSFNMRLNLAKLIDLAAIGQALYRGLRR